jgi:ornithine cyclodeaminase/alanine dehydrogenase-like protein (mu-crystallin family)
MTLTLSETDIAKALTYEQLIPAMEKALSDFSAGRVIQPVRNLIPIEEGKRFFGIMPAVSENAMGAKLVCFYPKNAGTAVPTHLAMIALFDPATGQPLAFMDGRLITEMRTAAVSAAVTKYLAPENSRVLTLLGSGVQAEAHLLALRRVCQFDEVRVSSRTPDQGPAALTDDRVQVRWNCRGRYGRGAVSLRRSCRQPKPLSCHAQFAAADGSWNERLVRSGCWFTCRPTRTTNVGRRP